MEPKDCVAINAFDSQGELVFSQYILNYEWYEALHPIIDSSKYREGLNVSRLEGKQYDESGEIIVQWLINYAKNGKLAEEWVWRRDRPVEYTRF